MPLPLCGDTASQAQLEKFLARWPLAKLRTMTLAEYATYGSKDCFIYWFEQVAPGDVGGFPLKSGIYGRDPAVEKTSDESTRYDETYAWSAKLGETCTQAFANVKAGLLAIVEGAQRGALPAMAETPFWPAMAWKIAFCYQHPERPVAAACFKEDSVRGYCQRFDLGTAGDSTALLHQAIIARNQQSHLPINLFELGGVIWRVGSFKGNIWNYSYERGDAEGINDLPSLLQSNEIKGNWPTSASLSSLPAEKKPAKIAALALLGEAMDSEEDAEEEEEIFDFAKLNVPQGAILTYVDDPQQKVKVVEPRRVEYRGEVVSLYDLTQRLKGRPLIPWASWEYQGTKLSKHYKEAFPQPKPTGSAIMCWQFAKKMQVGDLIFARKSRSQEYLVGIVKSDYIFVSSRPNYQHVRKVEWLRRTPKNVPEVSYIITKALTDISEWPVEVNLLFRALDFQMPNLTNIKAPPAVGSTKRKPTNVIFYGPPGTGKTYKTKEHAIRTCIGKDRYEKNRAEDDFKRLLANGQVEFTTFHQSYDYADFIIGFKPETVGDTMVFKPKPGLLLRIAKRARENSGQPYLLIMDEVNRGNISKIFGELITLIEKDKRSGGTFPLSITLPCSCPDYLEGDNHDQFSLPSNVHFLGTMNTADRSIALLDTALRRRFDFTEMAPNPDLLPTNLDGINLKLLLEKINPALRKKLTRDHQIGHAWFPMKEDTYDLENPEPTAKDLVEVMMQKILPLIDDWFYDDTEGKAEVLKGLATAEKLDPGRFTVTVESLRDYAGA
jgi:hypothetical protein